MSGNSIEGKEVGAFGGGQLPATTADLLAGLQNMGGNLATNVGGKPILRLIKSGEFVYGPDNIDVQIGSEWALNPATLQHGYACWVDSELLGEQLVPFTVPAPARATLPDYGHPEDWKQEAAFELRCMNGDDEGVTVLYKSTAHGFRKAVKELIVEMMKQAMADPTRIIPVLTLGVDSYTHKKHGLTFTPVLTVVRWIDNEGKSASAPVPAVTAQAAAVPVQAAAPAAIAAGPAPVAAAAPNAVAAPEAEPTRRRRRAV